MKQKTLTFYAYIRSIFSFFFNRYKNSFPAVDFTINHFCGTQQQQQSIMRYLVSMFFIDE